MPKEKVEILHIRVDADFWVKIDDWRETLKPYPLKRSDAVRYLIDLGLEAVTKGKKR